MTGAAAPFGLAPATSPTRFTRRQAAALVGALLAGLAAVTTLAVVGHPATAVRATAFGGSVVLDNALGGPVVVDLANGSPTLRLAGVGAQVGTTDEADVDAVPLGNGTLLVDRVTGTVNFLDPDQLVVAPLGAGVALPGPPGATAATAYPAGTRAYVARIGPTATTVSVVSRTTVAVAALLQHGATATATAKATTSVPVPTAGIGPLAGGGRPGAAVAAGGRLWALTATTAGTLRVVTVRPSASGAGALTVAPRPTVVPALPAAAPGVAATGSAPPGAANPPSAGGPTLPPAALAAAGDGPSTAVALATGRAVTVLAGPQAGGGADGRGPGSRRVALPAAFAATVRAIVPVGGESGRALFAYRTTAGWSLAGIDLTTGRRIGPVALHGLPAPAPGGASAASGSPSAGSSAGSSSAGSSAGSPSGGSSSAGAPGSGAAGPGAAAAGAEPVLLQPVADRGAIYALAGAGPGSRPVLERVDPGTGRATPVALAGDPSGVYPVVSPAEQPDWSTAEVRADGPRVVFDVPTAELAVMVFSDGSRRPRTIDKGSAVDINPSAPPSDQVAPARAPAAPPPPSSTAPTPQVVDAALACRTTTQKPNVPQVAPPQPATHAVTLSWTYPLIDRADCEPTSYTVAVTALAGAPQPAQSTVAVTGQTAVTVTGLQSDTTYRFVVTAYINAGATAAPPVVATTAAEGPPPAASVITTANGTNGWEVAWQPCTTGCTSTEPVAAWQVLASACDGSFVATLPEVTVPGTVTDTVVPFSAEPGLIGTSLSFAVQPVGVDGLSGDPTPDHACTEGWAPPQAPAISLDVAEPPASGTTATAVLTVTPPPGVADAGIYGSDHPVFVFHVGSLTQGPTGVPQASFGGLPVGVAQATSVDVYPAGHPGAAVNVVGPPVAPTVPWPVGLAMTATGQTDSFVSGTVTATIADAFAGVPAGVTMALDAAGGIVCGNEQTSVPATPVSPVAGGADGQVTVDLSALDGELGAPCTLSLSLSEPSTDVHGGPSPVLRAPFDASAPGTLTATWDPAPTAPYSGAAAVAVTASGNAGAVTGWTATVVGPPGCSATATSSQPDGTVVLDLQSCVAQAAAAGRQQGATSVPFDVTVAVSWTGPLGAETEDVAAPPQTLTLAGTPPAGG